MIKVAFQGLPGAYSHAALQNYFGLSTEAIPNELSEDVFNKVVNKECDYGFVPIENSIIGNVAVNMDLFMQFDVRITGEFYLPINHCLLALPGAKINNIKQAYSHPIALAQCRDFLHKKKIQLISDFDTAGSAKRISEQKNLEIAAVGSELCQNLYGLEILEKNIQTTSNNITRFVSFTRKEHNEADIKSGKMSLCLQTDHKPGALLNSLAIFSHYKINLTRLESRPVPENPFTYNFYVDFLCGENYKNIENAMIKLKELGTKVKILGHYPQNIVQS